MSTSLPIKIFVIHKILVLTAVSTLKIEGVIKAGCSCREVLMSRRKQVFRTKDAR